jgi:hypothetical protein
MSSTEESSSKSGTSDPEDDSSEDDASEDDSSEDDSSGLVTVDLKNVADKLFISTSKKEKLQLVDLKKLSVKELIQREYADSFGFLERFVTKENSDTFNRTEYKFTEEDIKNLHSLFYYIYTILNT